jgi:TetR/AcrR family transcriptional regulator, regulator of mycofactocin system
MEEGQVTISNDSRQTSGSEVDEADDRSRGGRPPGTSVDELTHVGLELFFERGFDATTVDDIAAAAGIGRRTFFRYFPSKNDLPWGDFDRLLDAMRGTLDAVPDAVPTADALRDAVVAFNDFPADEITHHRRRMALLLRVPALVAHSTLRYESWREVVAEFVARRTGEPVGAIGPQTTAYTCLAVTMSAYEQWLDHDDADLPDLIERAFSVLDDGLRRTGA